MKTTINTSIENLILLPTLIVGLGLIPAGRLTAQTFTTLYSFTPLNDYTNSDGANPVAGLILSGNTLYGTASYGGPWGNGTVFALSTNGTGFTTLHDFTAGVLNIGGQTVNSDGANPVAGLILSGNTLYGTAGAGGSNYLYGSVSPFGTVFALSTNAPVLRPSMISLQSYGTESNRRPDWSYRATPCMGRRWRAAAPTLARYSPSTPMARVIPCCMISTTRTGVIRKLD